MRTSFIVLAVLTLACRSEAEAPAPKPAEVKPAPVAKPEVKAPGKAAVRTVAMTVTENGYEPEKITLKKGEPVKFVVTRTTDQTCATDLLIDGTPIKVALPLNKAVEVAWTPEKTGKVKFGCAMGLMVSGILLVE